MLKLFAICSWAMGKAVVNCKHQSGFCVCYCLYLNVSLSLLALYIDVEAFLQYALGRWVKRWSIANISLVSAFIVVFVIVYQYMAQGKNNQ